MPGVLANSASAVLGVAVAATSTLVAISGRYETIALAVLIGQIVVALVGMVRYKLTASPNVGPLIAFGLPAVMVVLVVLWASFLNLFS